MRRAARACCCATALLLAAGTTVQATEPARIIDSRTWFGHEQPAAPGGTHELRLHLYVFRGSLWTERVIEPAVREAARLLAQCNVALAGAELRLLEAPRRFHSYSTPVARELLRNLQVTKPAVFFVDDTLNRPAYDAEAIGLANASTRPELANTVWIAHGARDLPLALAHELAHVLSDSGEHSEEPGNLMRAKTAPENTRLSDAQCRRLRERGAANGLLAPKP